MSYSPWGKIDNVETIMHGVSIVSTPGHGGIRITEKALKHHSFEFDFLVKYGAIKMGEYYFFEEDCAMFLMLFDCPTILKTYAEKYKQDAEEIFQYCKGSVQRWYPQFFEERD